MAPQQPRLVGQVKGPSYIAWTWGVILLAGMASFSWAKYDIYNRKVEALRLQREEAIAKRVRYLASHKK